MKKIDRHELIQAARALGLGKKASINEIRAAYKSLMKEWHPDRCPDGEEACLEMAKKISHAYALLIEYCEELPIDLSEEGIKSATPEAAREEFWNEHFGKDPLWGG